MRRLLLFSLLFMLPALVGAKAPRCTIRLHVEGNPNDTEVFSTQLKSQYTGKEVTIEKIPTLSERDVVAFRPYPAKDGTFGALFELDDHGRLALDTLSIEKRGTSLYVFVNGRPITEMQIDRRVSDGRVFIPAGMTPKEIELMRKQWPMIGARKR